MRSVMSFAAVVALALAIPTTDQDGWAEFKAKFGKRYSGPEEELIRKEIFMQSKAKVDNHNALFAAGLSTYEMALNYLSDWTDDELERRMGLKIPEQEESEEAEFHQLSGKSAPSSVDWRKKNVVTPVKDQGLIASGYAFSATGCLEGLLAIKNKKLVSLSEQEIVDCPFEGCNGSSGGHPWAVFKDLSNRVPGDPKGLQSEAEYPYTGEAGTCKYNKTKIVATDSGYKKVSRSEEALKDAVANIGPISVGIYVSSAWYYYKGGIFNDPLCSSVPEDANNAVLVVGYDEEKGHDYWIVKNSWGAKWGENGYMKISRGKNTCGIANFATYPKV